jgi:flagellar motility protein MotE (MotC chaperone)
MTASDELALVDAALQKLYESNVQEYSEATEKAVRLRFESLTKRRDDLQAQIASATGGIFKPITTVSESGSPGNTFGP